MQLSRFLPARVMCTEAELAPLLDVSSGLQSLAVPKLSSTSGRTPSPSATLCEESGTFGKILHAARILSRYEYILCASKDWTAHLTRFQRLELSASRAGPSGESVDSSLYSRRVSFFRAAGTTTSSRTVSCRPT